VGDVEARRRVWPSALDGTDDGSSVPFTTAPENLARPEEHSTPSLKQCACFAPPPDLLDIVNFMFDIDK
jgi:hypothetical protein